MATKVTIIVLTYNSSKYLDGCFGSLEKMERGDLAVEVIAVDNGSSDGTPQEITQRFPWVKVVDSGGNIGFSAGNNIAIRQALIDGADFVYLLNHDTEVEPCFLLAAVAVAETDPRIGSVQSLLLLHPERDLVNSSGNAIHFLGFGYCCDYRRPVDQLDRETVRDIAYASGAAVLFRCSALKKVGLLDERLFMYHEDLDLGWRLLLANYRNVLAPQSVVWHKYEFSRSIAKLYFMERNRYIILLKNLRLWSLLVIAPGLIIAEAFLALSAVRGGWWKKKLRALSYFLRPKAWRHIFCERDMVAATRLVSDRDILHLFTYEIRDQEGSGPFTLFIANPLMGQTWRIMKYLIR
ncbi:glycosyltransferase family 2 protein [Patescibacteria group bacterium]|nr:glycosyltransferase family 2 protein [Patescibacteria group bacterium]